MAAALPFMTLGAAHAAPEAACIENIYDTTEALIIDTATLVLHKPGVGYKRVDVVNHPLAPDDGRLHRPYALCVNDQIAPLGIERGVSVVAAITDISNEEANALRRIDFTDREKYKPLPVNRINFARAGRIGELCNDVLLTVFQIKQCAEMMRNATTAEARDEIRDTVRFIIKKRQALHNQSPRWANESARNDMFYRNANGNAVPNPPPPQR
jgi:hypothetical protein